MQVPFTIKDIQELAVQLEGNFAHSNLVKYAIAHSLECQEAKDFFLRELADERMRASANRKEMESRVQNIPAAVPGKRKKEEEEPSEETKDDTRGQ